jgi:hypothetical protein
MSAFHQLRCKSGHQTRLIRRHAEMMRIAERLLPKPTTSEAKAGAIFLRGSMGEETMDLQDAKKWPELPDT